MGYLLDSLNISLHVQEENENTVTIFHDVQNITTIGLREKPLHYRYLCVPNQNCILRKRYIAESGTRYHYECLRDSYVWNYRDQNLELCTKNMIKEFYLVDLVWAWDWYDACTKHDRCKLTCCSIMEFIPIWATYHME